MKMLKTEREMVIKEYKDGVELKEWQIKKCKERTKMQYEWEPKKCEEWLKVLEEEKEVLQQAICDITIYDIN